MRKRIVILLLFVVPLFLGYKSKSVIPVTPMEGGDSKMEHFLKEHGYQYPRYIYKPGNNVMSPLKNDTTEWPVKTIKI